MAHALLHGDDMHVLGWSGLLSPTHLAHRDCTAFFLFRSAEPASKRSPSENDAEGDKARLEASFDRGS
jgi:hypothetical protein